MSGPGTRRRPGAREQADLGAVGRRVADAARRRRRPGRRSGRRRPTGRPLLPASSGAAGRPGEGRERHPGLVAVAAAVERRDRRLAGQRHVRGARRRAGVAVEAGRPPSGWTHQQRRRGDGHALDHVLALGHHGAPPVGRGCAERRRDDPAPWRVERGGADRRSPTTGNAETASTPSMTVVRAPVVRSIRWTSTRVQPEGDVEEQPAAVPRQSTPRPGGRVGQVVEHELVGGRGRRPARATRPCGGSRAPRRHRVGVGVAGVGERGRRRAATRPTAARVFGISSGRQLAGRRRRSPAACCARRRRARCRTPPAGRRATGGTSRARRSPRRGTAAGRASRRGSAAVAGGVAHEQDGLVEAAPPLDGEQPVAGRRRTPPTMRTRAARPTGPAARRAAGPRVEHGPGPLVLGRRPRLHLGVGPVLEPAVGVGHLDAVQHVHHVVPPRRHRRRVRRLAPDRFCVRISGDRQRSARRSAGTGLVGRARVLARRAAVAVDGPVTVPAGGVAVARRPAGRGARRASPTACGAPRRGVRRPTGHRGRRGRGAGAS